MRLPCLLFLEHNNHLQERRIQLLEALLQATVVLAVVDMVSGDLLLLLPGLLVEEFLRQLYCIRPSLLLL
jgi:hypothetical protein